MCDYEKGNPNQYSHTHTRTRTRAQFSAQKDFYTAHTSEYTLTRTSHGTHTNYALHTDALSFRSRSKYAFKFTKTQK